jgi:polysaccharide pyruvyl transferase WcaK-like protein
MQTNIFVIGYYNHNNIGDCQYKLTFNYIIKKYLDNFKINFIDCDTLQCKEFLETDVILVGGGDVLNDYFVDKIIEKFKAKPNKIIAVSVGIPYTSILNSNKLDIFDYIFIRTRQDLQLLGCHFNSERVMYLPDLSYFLNSITTNIDTLRMIQKKLNIKISNKGSKIITICLSRHIYHEDYKNNYTDIIKGMSQYIAQLIIENYHIMLLPFNTNKDNNFENDIIVNEDILQCLKNVYKLDYTKYITVINKTIEPCDINSLLNISYIVIPMRFHACLLSIYNNIPILPIFTTRKIKNLLLDIKWTDYYKLPTNEHDIPVSLSNETLMEKTKNLITNYNTRVNDLNKTNTYFFGKDMTCMITKFINLIKIPYDKIYKDKPIIHFVSNSDIIKNLYEKIINLIEYKGFKELYNVDEKTKNFIVSIVSYHLAEKNINSSYNYGLKEKMFLPNYNYIEEWLWILNDNNSKCKPITLESNTNGLFNINYLDQIDYSGVHRSGWQYVFENVSYLHDDNHPLLLDMYLDRTFTWNSEINEILNFIPYKKSWIGFIHHTFDTSFSKNNCYTMFENPLFIESLKCCKGLIKTG